MSPVCATCAREMRVERNGQEVTHRSPYDPRCWSGDLWTCDGCGARVVLGFGAAFEGGATVRDPVRFECRAPVCDCHGSER